jgi:hypothetical protein
MDVRDINVLKRSEKNSGLYDLTKVTYRSYEGQILVTEYKVPKWEEMRIDLICNKLYGTTEYIDFLLNFNSISNPLNIREGAILRYVSIDDISKFYYNQTAPEDVQKKLSSAGRATQQDPNRQAYNEQNFPLPPNVMDKPTQQVVVNGQTIKIQGLFKQ